MEPVFPDQAIQCAIRMKVGEALRCYYDIRPTLPERLYELVSQLERKAHEAAKSRIDPA
jgi:hypothetical protein